jgi:vacuolar-type H+-ATPase subunit H
MQEVVDEVLKAEAGAQEIIDKAGQEAAHLKQQAENETNRRIAEAETKNERFWEQNAEKIDGLVKKLVDFLVTPEFEKD